MSGYWCANGYVGFVNGAKMLFSSDIEYYEYMEDHHESE